MYIDGNRPMVSSKVNRANIYLHVLNLTKEALLKLTIKKNKT